MALTQPETVPDHDDIAAWLLEQIAEDERLARDGQGACAHLDLCDDSGSEYYDAFGFDRGPARVLAECEAKRRILAIHNTWRVLYPDSAGFLASNDECLGCGLSSDEEAVTLHIDDCPVLRAMSLPFGDRPGYQERWRP